MPFPDDLKALDERVAIQARSALGKLMASPLHLGRARLLEEVCRRRGTIARVRPSTFWGDPFVCFVPEVVSTSINRYGYFEEELTRVFYERLKPGMTFFDVGAHFGYFSLLAAHLVGSKGHVHSFEPTGSTFNILSENVRGRPNIKVNNAAVFSSEKELEFMDFGVGHSAFNSVFSAPRTSMATRGRERFAPKKIIVQAWTIDGYIERTGARPNLIKLDAEGAELEIIRGMERTLGRIRPEVTLEVGDWAVEGMPASRVAVDAILAFGYRAMEFVGGRLAEHTAKERYDYDNILFVPR